MTQGTTNENKNSTKAILKMLKDNGFLVKKIRIKKGEPIEVIYPYKFSLKVID